MGKNELKKILVKETVTRRGIIFLKVKEVDIYCSTNHRFYIVDKGWVRADDIKIGDKFTSISEKAEILLTQKKLLPPDMEVKVYNLVHVEDNHTFFVTKYGLLVHNRKVAVPPGENENPQAQ